MTAAEFVGWAKRSVPTIVLCLAGVVGTAREARALAHPTSRCEKTQLFFAGLLGIGLNSFFRSFKLSDSRGHSQENEPLVQVAPFGR